MSGEIPVGSYLEDGERLVRVVSMSSGCYLAEDAAAPEDNPRLVRIFTQEIAEEKWRPVEPSAA